MMYRRLYAAPENLIPETSDVTQWIRDLRGIPTDRVVGAIEQHRLEIAQQDIAQQKMVDTDGSHFDHVTNGSSLTDRTATNVADTDGRPVVPARANNQQDAGNVQLPHIARVQNISNLAGDQEEEDGHERWATE
jgi:hypothetical protein